MIDRLVVQCRAASHKRGTVATFTRGEDTTAAVMRTLAASRGDEDVPTLRAQCAELRGRRDDLAALLADGLLSATAVRERSAGLTRQITALEDRIARALGESPVAALTDADDVAEAWDQLPLRDRKQVIDTLMTVTILPAGKGARFDPERQLRIEWKGATS
jgi:hypothetical protein